MGQVSNSNSAKHVDHAEKKSFNKGQFPPKRLTILKRNSFVMQDRARKENSTQSPVAPNQQRQTLVPQKLDVKTL